MDVTLVAIQEKLVYALALVILWVLTDLGLWLKKQIDAKRARKEASIESTLEKHLKIEMLLADLLHIQAADRVYLAQIHNGLITSARMHMYKFSISHEVCSVGTSREKETIRNIQIEDHLFSIKQLVDNKFCCVDTVGKMRSGLTKAQLSSMGVRSGMYVAIHDRTQTLVAFLAVEWVDKPKNISKDLASQGVISDQASLLQLALLG